uniref:Uncharacterized protein n=1 Tax=Anguilla anguilla TaxID=7936 RepID=A0A0E9T7Z6_ANGAN
MILNDTLNKMLFFGIQLVISYFQYFLG